MLSSISSEVGTLFIERAKRYVRFELEIISSLEPQDVEDYGFVLLVELAIASAIPSSLSKTTKKILSRLPSWTKAFEDSLDSATPDNQQPTTVAGKFINALVNDFPEKFDRQVNLFELDRYITTADENQLAWINVVSDVPASFISITGDNIPLSRVESISELYESLETDYTYYYNPIDREIFTLKLHKIVLIDGNAKDPIPILRWNWFDEFGARVGLERLYLESNSNFKKRILDVYINKPGTTKEQIKKTLRRELDIWAAYGSTPDSNYIGATPELMEISDIESSTPYFELSGKPTEEFRKFVRDLNEKYPVNWGYVKWDNGFWDYAGQDQSGVGRVPAVYDDSTPLGKYYQPGVGDFNDAKIIISEPYSNDIDFEARFKASGSYLSGYADLYSPVKVDYEYYGSYYIDYYDNDSSTVNFKYTVESSLDDKFYYTEFYYYPKNAYSPDSPASPEYESITIFDQDGFSYSQYEFKEVGTDNLYLDDSSIPSTSRLNIFDTKNAKLETLSPSVNGNYNIKFFGSEDILSTTGSSVSIDKTEYYLNSYNIQTSSNIYNKKRQIRNTDRIKNSAIANASNNQEEPLAFEINKDFIHKTVVFESGATPLYIHIDNVKPEGYSPYPESIYFSEEYLGYGGLSIDPNSFDEYLIPSSPNLNIRYINPNFATPQFHDHFIIEDGGGFPSSAPSTVNYYFVETKYPYNSTPDSIQIFTNEENKVLYPYQSIIWESFEELSTPIVYGKINKNGLVNSNNENKDETFSNHSDLVGRYILGYDTFGISPENHYIEKIEIVNDTEGVELKTSSEFISIYNEDSFYDNTIDQYIDNTLSEISVTARYTGRYNSFLSSGWYSEGEEDNYIYSNPVTESYATPGFEIILSQPARQGAPIIVNLNSATPYQLREVAFYDEATPTMPSLRNIEVLYGNKGNSLYLGYEDISNAEVVDLVTGYVVASNVSSETNKIEVFSDSTPSIYNREYQVSYNVSKSFAVDNDSYNESTEKYTTKILFESTPSDYHSYEVTYESSINQMSTPISLEVDPMKLWDQEGFVYLSHRDYNFADAIVNLNPSYILDDGKDYMVITINSIDENGNSKPYQTFQLSSDVLAFTEEYITTDINGFAYARAIYIGEIPATLSSSSLEISGVSSTTSYGHPNSSSENFNIVINFDITRNLINQFETKATASNQVLYADGISQTYIYGIAKESSTPSSGSVVYWRRGRSLYEVFEATPYSDYSVADENGVFKIGPFTASGNEDPGVWLVAVETEHSNVFSSTPVTKSGDIVYWSEKYDNLKYSYGDTVFYNPIVLYEDRIGIMSTPNFTVNYYNGENASPYGATPNWLPPKWYPLDRYTQYQIGLLGSTPYQVDSYENLMNDYEEE